MLTDGFEEVEAVTPIDLLRRAGLEVIVAGLEKKDVTGSHGIRLTADVLLKDVKETPDAIVLPGGPGADTLGKSEEVRSIVRFMASSGKIVGAICAAPAMVLAPAGVLEGKTATCFPGLEGRLGSKTTFSEDRVVTDGDIITSRGAGTAMEFSLELIKKLISAEKAREVSTQILAV